MVRYLLCTGSNKKYFNILQEFKSAPPARAESAGGPLLQRGEGWDSSCHTLSRPGEANCAPRPRRVKREEAPGQLNHLNSPTEIPAASHDHPTAVLPLALHDHMTEIPLGSQSHVTTDSPMRNQAEAAAAAGPTTPSTPEGPQVAGLAVQEDQEERRPTNPKIILGKVEVGPVTNITTVSAIHGPSRGDNLTANHTTSHANNSSAPAHQEDDHGAKEQNLSQRIMKNYKEKVASFTHSLAAAMHQVTVRCKKVNSGIFMFWWFP